ncbi:MFS transporter [Enemella evansiae]|uniref:MFS transporter n=1 Tax=Enemella evansiae TaxID=2016499 RepID=UPI000B9737EE|nr:MFS transporter [Enemella evansiae]OYO06783.1 MFS transporter [Enemella evansiae]TDO91588.1 putative MFS family arabinose efflux permease [Enemella evansiae]
MSTTAQTPATLNTPQMRRILASAFLGSAIEFYDFALFSIAAALVFNKVFFAGMDPVVGTFASFMALATGYVARPLGGVIFGHFGDRIGRKKMLVLSMLLMGAATVALGLLPGSAQIGALAPILLVTLRVVQGIAVGGEWGGAATLALEHAPGGRRGLAATFASSGGPAGVLLATLVTSAFTLLPQQQFLAWGWRIPFLLSLALVIIGLWVRSSVAESPIFVAATKKVEERRIPIAEVLLKHPKMVVVGILVASAQFTVGGIMTVWAVSRAVQSGANQTQVLNIKAGSAVIVLIVTFTAAALSDRYGRKLIMAIGMIGMALFTYPALVLVESGSVRNFAIALVVAQIFQSMTFGPLAGYLSELFPTKVRFTGASLTYQGGSTLGAGFSPAIATAVIAAGGVGALAGAWSGLLVLCLLALLLGSPRGRDRIDLEAIDEQEAAEDAVAPVAPEPKTGSAAG